MVELFERHKRNRSIRQMMKVASEGGYWIPVEASWRQWANPNFEAERTTFPSPDTIRAFAVGMGATETEVLMAIGRSLGLDVGPENDTDLILPGAGVLGAAEKNMLATMAAFLVSKMEG
ncbi:hypothetical protein [Arthrobacter bambusae]|uniref:hypothetical protein n=1 Tax=Arthrobacter bambusae TaxID=1338426 RepID=UPI0027886166|nr:hypothetical protein [Arthrobacter bambusae]MDQ0241249.1 hypothetical protein [Arthrobacter bambusae]